MKPEAVESALQRAAEYLANGDWRYALTEYGALAKCGQRTNDAVIVGMAKALAQGGHINDAYLALNSVFNQPSRDGHERQIC